MIVTDDSCDIVVKADKSQFKQVLINLFKNGFEAMTAVDEKMINISCY